jgi:glycosyltransferase involved in cell wall biosynthesis
MEKRKNQILMIVQFPENVSPCQRFRCELYQATLEKNGFEVTTKSFLDLQGYKVVHQYGFLFRKSVALVKGFIRRMALLFRLGKYDFILVQREFAPVGPPVFEWLAVKIFQKKLIYDFDDAIWIPSVSDQNSIAGKFKNARKVNTICRLAYRVSAGNDYLCNHARQYNKNVVYNPTCVDTTNRYSVLASHETEKITVTWTGSFSTLKYLNIVESALKKLQEKYDFNVKIICNRQPSLDLKNVQYVEWSEENEVSALASCQIGLMPLTADEWSEGKCGFKLIQYLSLGIPAVSSSVGVNKKIIEDGVNGYFADSDAEWYNNIEKLLLNADLRKKMGIAGRQKMVDRYSLQSNESNFLNLFSGHNPAVITMRRSPGISLRRLVNLKPVYNLLLKRRNVFNT